MYAGIGCTGAAKDFPAACLIPPADFDPLAEVCVIARFF
jgi:hypothetical protein